MRILIIKLSSIGDIIHTFPAIMDIINYNNNIEIDWLIDQQFSALPQILNQAYNKSIINNIIAISLRKIKNNLFNFNIIKYLIDFKANFKDKKYDLIIDTQGLLKSAILAKLIKKSSVIYGFNKLSCRESIASIFYDCKFNIDKNLHAITRIRYLFAKIFNYDINLNLNLIINNNFPKIIDHNKYIVFLHGTTWENKHWPEQYWYELSKLLANNIKIIILEKFKNNNFNNIANLIILDNLDIYNITCLLAHATLVVGVDTGFSHLAGLLETKTIGVYGPTCTEKSKVMGNNAVNIQSDYHCSPCLSRICLEYKNKKSRIKQPCMLAITPEKIYNLIKLWDL